MSLSSSIVVDGPPPTSMNQRTRTATAAAATTKLTYALSTLLLLLVGAVIVLSFRSSGSSHSEHHALIRSTCSSTLYPDLCFSSVASSTDPSREMKTAKDVIRTGLEHTVLSTQKNYFTFKKKLAARSLLRARQATALYDCLEMVAQTLHELNATLHDLIACPNGSRSIARVIDDMKTYLSAAMTNQDSCLDGFSHSSAEKKLRETLKAGQTYVFQLCSNALAMIRNMANTDSLVEDQNLPAGGEGKGAMGWPEWLSDGDRRLLQSTTITPDITVAADGSGNYRTVAEAVAAAPSKSSTRFIIRIKAGVYRENVEVPSSKINLMFVGDGRMTTIITASRNVVDGSTTFNSATVAIVGDGFLARDITFQNSAGPSKHQAVALRVNADLSAFYRCGMLAYQDTLYVHSLRQFFVECVVVGTVDFIFGNAAAVLQNCDIQARLPNPGQRNMVTAQGRDDPNQNTGIVIQKCRIGATSDLQASSGVESYLGRPWKEYSRTVVMQSSITDVIHPAGWYPWDGNFALNTLYYAEYANTGAGASTAGRVDWGGFRVITASEARAFTVSQFISGDNWLPATGFPYSPGL
ncbi:hypothetical protein SAY86_009532 [Trapa natans]|uniref:Pectinesterase n=1 Tax=Trapa natans TaxID=22666 RepID=A0AAN7KW59_TRANT|nr:hypothetical protein SAY86_009532 [Trapa natans]